MPPPKSAFSRLLDHFHTHPKGRLHEILFWVGLGLVLGGASYAGFRVGYVNSAIALLLSVIALCFIGFGLLPQRKRRGPAPVPKGKRGTIAQQVQASKAERKRKPKH